MVKRNETCFVVVETRNQSRGREPVDAARQWIRVWRMIRFGRHDSGFGFGERFGLAKLMFNFLSLRVLGFILVLIRRFVC